MCYEKRLTFQSKLHSLISKLIKSIAELDELTNSERRKSKDGERRQLVAGIDSNLVNMSM